MTWTDQRFVALDTETTGLDPWSGDRVIEVGLVTYRLDGQGNVVSTESEGWLVDPGIPLPRTTVQITGIRDEQVAGQPAFAQLADAIDDRLRGAIWIAHNLPFDTAFLEAEFQRLGRDRPAPLARIDTVDVSRRFSPDARSHRLGDVAARLGVPLVEAHRAVNDAAACALALFEMMRRDRIPDDLPTLCRWAGGVGPVPTGPGEAYTVDDHGHARFVDGPYASERAEAHPLHLSWLTAARVRQDRRWAWRYGERSRAWARSVLDATTTGRMPSHGKAAKVSEWGLDSCIAPEVTARLARAADEPADKNAKPTATAPTPATPTPGGLFSSDPSSGSC
jgi:DNA polymerase III epsilon subunit-like protein